MAAHPKLSLRQQASVRDHIETSKLVKFLQDHAIKGRTTKNARTRMRAAEILLRKVLPDLASVEHSGEMTQHYVAEVPAVAPTAEEWSSQHAPSVQ